MVACATVCLWLLSIDYLQNVRVLPHAGILFRFLAALKIQADMGMLPVLYWARLLSCSSCQMLGICRWLANLSPWPMVQATTPHAHE